jgi:nitrogen-specific signal transduction histidine kinase
VSDAPPSDAESARRLLVHEMRNAIGAIRTATELLQRRYHPEGRDRRLFEVIFSEIDRLDNLADGDSRQKP